MGCPKNPDAPDLSFQGKPYTTDSGTQSIVRKERGKTARISCSSPEFNGRICYTIDEINKHYDELTALSYKCERWRPEARGAVKAMGFETENLEPADPELASELEEGND